MELRTEIRVMDEKFKAAEERVVKEVANRFLDFGWHADYEKLQESKSAPTQPR